MPSAWNTIHHRGNKVFFTEEVRFFFTEKKSGCLRHGIRFITEEIRFFHRGKERMPSAWNTIHHRGNKVFFTEEVSFFSQRNRVDAFGMEYDSSQRK
jgi:hypothetical protein